MLKSEEVVFEHHPDATHFRYPYIYGKYQIAPREWSIVRRIQDGRPHIIIPDSGLSHDALRGRGQHGPRGAARRGPRRMLARGQIYNCGDDKLLTLRQVVEICTRALDYEWEIVSMPYELAVSARPMIAQPWTTHRVFDLTKIKQELGYEDIVDPIAGMTEAVRWYAEAGVDPRAEKGLQDPFDYEAEDKLIDAYRARLDTVPRDLFAVEPGYTGSYSGPGGSKRKAEW